VEQPLSHCSLQSLIRQYDLGTLRSVHRLEQGFVNENWVVVTTHGRYFLKRRHPDLRDPEVMSAQHALIQHLRKSGFPVPAILKHLQGKTFLELDGDFYEIHEYIEGEPDEHSNEAHFNAAALWLGLYSPSRLSANLTKIREVWKLDQDDSLIRIWLQLAAQAVALAGHFSEHEELPRLVIHGDYHGGNLLFKGDRLVGVFDYDKARMQPRVVELAEALIYFASTRPGHLKHVVYPGFLDLDKFGSFLRYYSCGVCTNEGGFDWLNTSSELHFPSDKQDSSGVSFLRDGEVYALSDYICCIWLSVSLQRLLEKDAGQVPALAALQEVRQLGEWGARNREIIIGHTYAARKG